MNPTFSIVTAVKNGLPELIRTFNSLQSQTNHDFEWVVIDAASNDGTLEWLSGLTNINGGYKWVSENDKGIADAWNKGIRMSEGSQILILNAGDTYDPILVETFLTKVSDNKITCCHARIGRSDKPPIFYAQPNLLWRGMHVPHNWCSVPLSIYKSIGLYKNINHSMDFEWFARYYKFYGVYGFDIINQALGEYALGGHSDINYVEGFKFNEHILIANGMNPIKAKLLRSIYTLKHLLRYRIRKILSL